MNRRRELYNYAYNYGKLYAAYFVVVFNSNHNSVVMGILAT